jgi:hypothetical protein
VSEPLWSEQPTTVAFPAAVVVRVASCQPVRDDTESVKGLTLGVTRKY